ncbi:MULTISPECIES: phage tail protein [Paenibacillus]|uniref:phage tail protein n=1 Tax=Paenibacillus TaxID=44249 RepID=UPI000AD7628A|nr:MULTISPECIES: phage tail protein [Paenibacillus]MDF2644454.1 phage tail protein [Paenibacillus sp.]MDQ0903665.1 phage tail-like protein [Paenibacillus sp. V4I7]MDQ0917860.1 phage tail-like protein [Paenibacillus sp. V4I5]
MKQSKNESKLHNVGGAFRFEVELDGLIVGGFSEVTGMKSETEVKPLWEGGVNTHPHYMIEHTKYPNIVLKRGITTSSELWEWYNGVAQGKIKRKNGSIILHNQAGTEMCRWNFFSAFPVKWNGPDLNASSGNVAIESIELVHAGLKTIFKK